MSLLDEISGALVIVVDDDRRIAYVWHGGPHVQVLDEGGREVDFFAVGGGVSKPTPAHVRAVIDRVIAVDD